MRIAVLGTGMVGQSLAGGLAERGHEVVVGTRDPATSLARTDPGGFGTWAGTHPAVGVARFAEATVDADLVVNALPGEASVAGVGAATVADGTIVLDVANPLDAGHGMPPTLFVANTDSLAEQLQRTFPALRVVKSLNTMTAPLMVTPRELADGDFSTFVCGDDDEAKALVTGLLTDLGHRDVIDLGDITAARGVEAMMLVWLRLWGVVGSARFTYKIVR
ncbi:NADPH-dependent F420 reductase [Propionicimonas sp.]|uniref:NADPH-dependent F420 reductase n=1 Tax=Propionicimonas sp. TaxID=1955623 RepID=UPI0039E3BDD8